MSRKVLADRLDEKMTGMTYLIRSYTSTDRQLRLTEDSLAHLAHTFVSSDQMLFTVLRNAREKG